MEKLLYEVIPPPKSWAHEKVNEWTAALCRMLHEERVNVVNLPEVINENREESRTLPYLEKVDTLEFSRMVRMQCPFLHPIPNKICVRMSNEGLVAWSRGAARNGMNRFVLVGGEHSSIRYPGPSVLKAAKFLKSELPELTLGGITIFTRKGEAKRIVEKMRHGIDFFVSQIIFETSNVKCVLFDLERLCRWEGFAMPHLYLSLAPACSKADIEFMQWLGVEFPTAVLSHFMDCEEEDISERVFEVIEFNLEDLAHFITRTRFDIGFNVEQIMYRNLECGRRLLQLVKKKVGHCLF